MKKTLPVAFGDQLGTNPHAQLTVVEDDVEVMWVGRVLVKVTAMKHLLLGVILEQAPGGLVLSQVLLASQPLCAEL